MRVDYFQRLLPVIFSVIIIIFSSSSLFGRELNIRIEIGKVKTSLYIRGRFGRKYKTWHFVKSGSKLLIYGKKKRYTKIILYGSNKKFIKYRGILYRGYVELYCYGKYIYVVNVLSMENYIKGVVPKEIGTGKNVTEEALKAQAVVARSYAIAMMGKHKKEGFDLCNRTHCQVYGGKSAETWKSNIAVKRTRGIILRSDGKVIAPYYHAYCGGLTATPDEVWPGAKRNKNFVTVHCDGCKKHNYWWKAEIGEREFLNKLKKNGYNLKQINSLRVLKVSKSSRIAALMFFGKKQSVIISGHVLRKIFGSTLIKSTMFNIKIKNNGTKSSNLKNYDSIGRIIKLHSIGDVIRRRIARRRYGRSGKVIIISGCGFGHGVGMCQNGAIYYSKKGYSYRYILKKYIKNVEIKKIY